MNNSDTFKMFASTTLMAIILGTISGLFWAIALSQSIKIGLLYGCITGIIVGFIFSILSKAASSSKNIQNKEVAFAAGSMMTLIFMASTAIAIVIGLVRWLFF